MFNIVVTVICKEGVRPTDKDLKILMLTHGCSCVRETYTVDRKVLLRNEKIKDSEAEYNRKLSFEFHQMHPPRGLDIGNAEDSVMRLFMSRFGYTKTEWDNSYQITY